MSAERIGCGCYLEPGERNHTCLEEWNIKRCSLHAAAPRMLDFIRAAAKLDLGSSECSGSEARAILRDVEGESNG